jgi:MFS family permease
LKTLAIVVSIFFFTSNLSGSFLTIYFKDLGLGLVEIAEILLFTFLVIGILPLVLLKTVKSFERIFSFGIFFTMLFYISLIYVRNPITLGLAYGLGIATFWPSFNLLQFRLSESRMRARTVSLLSSIIPSLASIVGPAVGGLIIENFEFTTLFVIAVILYFVAFILSMRMQFKLEVHGFSIPKNNTFAVFFISFIILGFSEAYWVVYPFFVLGISKTILNMGLVLASSAVLMSLITFLVNWLSDIKKARVNFTIIGTLLNIVWYLAIAHATTMHEIVLLSLLSGFAGAFTLSWFAHFGDSFGKEHYASILVLMEVGLMIGRILNLAPTLIFVPEVNYVSYFALLGLVLISMIPLCIVSKRKS